MKLFLKLTILVVALLFSNFLSRNVFAVEPFTFSPNPAKQGDKVTLHLHPVLYALLQYPATKNAPKYIYLNDKFLPPKVLNGGRTLVVTIPKGAKSGYLEMTCKQYRWKSTKRLVISGYPGTVTAVLNQGLLSKASINPAAIKSLKMIPQVSLQVQPQYVIVPINKRGRMKNFNVNIKINHSSPITEMTFRVRGELPPGKKFGGKWYDFDIEIDGNRFHGQQSGSITKYNPPDSTHLSLRLRRRFGHGSKTFKYTIEVRVKDSQGSVGTRTVEVVMKKAY